MTPHRILITGAAGEVGSALREHQPKDRRHLSTWFSPRDAAQLFARPVTTPDDAEAYAADVEHIHGDESDITEQRQGGIFVDSAYVGRAAKRKA